MDDFTSGRKRARAQDWAKIARALGVAPETLGAYLLAAQQGESEPTPTLKGEADGPRKALAAQFEQSQSLIRAAIARRAVRESPAAESGDESASAAAGTAPEAAPDKH